MNLAFKKALGNHILLPGFGSFRTELELELELEFGLELELEDDGLEISDISGCGIISGRLY
jgi:hypothetical protein